MRLSLISVFFVFATSSLSSSRLSADYDPLLTAKAAPDQKELVVKDAGSVARDSHPSLSSRRQKAGGGRVVQPRPWRDAGRRAYLGNHWALRGYIAVFLEHPGSDNAVWKDKPPDQRMTALRNAANLENFDCAFRMFTSFSINWKSGTRPIHTFSENAWISIGLGCRAILSAQ